MAASIVLFIIVVQIGVSYIANQKDVSIPTRRNMTIAFFFAVVCCMVAYDVAVMDPSYYDILGVSPGVDSISLKKAYKSLSKKLHPDKNPNDPHAAENFMLMQEVYEVLSTRDLRETYDSYGQEYMINARISPRSKSVDLSYERLLMYHAPFYFISALVAYALTISKKSNDARPYAFVMLFGLAIAEWYCKSYHDSLWFIPLTIYQQVECLKNIYHYMLQGAIMYSGLCYLDLEGMKLSLLSVVKQQLERQETALRNQEIMLRLLIQHVVKNKKSGNVLEGEGEGEGSEQKSKILDQLSNLTAQGKKKALERKIQKEAGAAIEKAKAAQSKEHPWGLYIFIGLSLLNYFSK
mmetsp:Transcript_24740/g.43998  ORF Transcript_24740/g.43998 Transcript_24740/m.43998 type:complete len:351 (-) Transcript_24740:13-1065(-)